MADPGFPIGAPTPLGAPMFDAGAFLLFGENVCEYGRLGSHWGGRLVEGAPLGSATELLCSELVHNKCILSCSGKGLVDVQLEKIQKQFYFHI